jgi:hypothetical protein
MSTTSTKINKKGKKSRNDNDMNKDRNSNMPSTTKKQPPLFEQFNAIVENGKQQNANSKKNHSQKTRGGASVQRCDSESSQSTNKKLKITQPPNQITNDSNYHSGSSYAEDEGYDEIPKQSHNLKVKSDIANAMKESSDSDMDDSENEGSVTNNIIKDTVDNSSVETKNTDEKIYTNKKTYEYSNSVLSPQLTTSLQWYVRNTLFQRVKIIDETHLEGNGQIIQEALDTIKIDKSSIHINSYINDCRRVIKRAMCSRRGYVKRQIGKKLKCKCGTNFNMMQLIVNL